MERETYLLGPSKGLSPRSMRPSAASVDATNSHVTRLDSLMSQIRTPLFQQPLKPGDAQPGPRKAPIVGRRLKFQSLREPVCTQKFLLRKHAEDCDAQTRLSTGQVDNPTML